MKWWEYILIVIFSIPPVLGAVALAGVVREHLEDRRIAKILEITSGR